MSATIDSNFIQNISNNAVILGCLVLLTFTYVFNTFWKEDIERMMKERRKKDKQLRHNHN